MILDRHRREEFGRRTGGNIKRYPDRFHSGRLCLDHGFTSLRPSCDHSKQPAGEKLPDIGFVGILIRAVAIVHTYKDDRTGDMDPDVLIRVGDWPSTLIQR